MNRSDRPSLLQRLPRWTALAALVGLAACRSGQDEPSVRDTTAPAPLTPVEPVEPLQPLEPDPLPEAEPATPDPEPEARVAPTPEAEEVDPRFDKRFRKGLTRGNAFAVFWRPLGGDVPKNEHFEVEVWLYRNEPGGELVPLPGARLAVSGWMPDHGHGMIRKPQATDRGEGRYVVKGMLLQMGGHWQVFFDILVEGQSERAQFDLVL